MHRSGLLLLQRTDDSVGGISWNDLGVVKHIELLGSVTASVQKDSLLSSRVVGEESSHVKDLTVDNDPAIIFLVVLRHLLHGVLARWAFAGRSSSGGGGGRGRRRRLSSIEVASKSTKTAASLADSDALSLEEVCGGRVTGDTTEYNATQEGRTTKTVGTVHTSGDLTSCEKTSDRLARLVEDSGFSVDLETTHGVVEDRGHDGDVEEVVKLPLALEELLAKRILLGAHRLVVVLESLLEHLGGETELLGEGLTAIETLHQATPDVVLAMPLNLLGCFAVEDETDRELFRCEQRSINSITKIDIPCRSPKSCQ